MRYPEVQLYNFKVKSCASFDLFRTNHLICLVLLWGQILVSFCLYTLLSIIGSLKNWNFLIFHSLMMLINFLKLFEKIWTKFRRLTYKEFNTIVMHLDWLTKYFFKGLNMSKILLMAARKDKNTYCFVFKIRYFTKKCGSVILTMYII